MPIRNLRLPFSATEFVAQHRQMVQQSVGNPRIEVPLFGRATDLFRGAGELPAAPQPPQCALDLSGHGLR
jgi:hypothetical protein